MNGKVIYVPLDERYRNYGYPYELGKFAGMDILRPPEEIMSRIKQPCDIEALWEWLFDNVQYCDYAVLSLDMLVYGCMLNSRCHQMTAGQCMERLDRLRKLKEINPKLEIHAFILIMRVALSNNCEEPDYWEKFGTLIHDFSYLSHKEKTAGLSSEEKRQLVSLARIIPAEYLADFVGRRNVNLKVGLMALDLVEEKVIDYLVISKDVTSEFGFSTEDQGVIYNSLCQKSIQSRVLIYPGTDEVGSTLVARVCNRIRGITPKVYVYYSSTLGPGIMARYEDRPIHESVKSQVLSAGGMVIDNYNDADIVLMANTPGKYMLQADEQFKVDHTYINFRNLLDFIQKVRYFGDMGKVCIVADIAYSNGADNELMELLVKEGLISRISGYSGWNTVSNTLGFVILEGVVALASGIKTSMENRDFFKFHIQKLIMDWAYHANILVQFADTRSVELGYDPFKLGSLEDRLADEIADKLNGFMKEHLNQYLPVRDICIKGVKLAWNRIYDAEFDLDIETV